MAGANGATNGKAGAAAAKRLSAEELALLLNSPDLLRDFARQEALRQVGVARIQEAIDLAHRLAQAEAELQDKHARAEALRQNLAARRTGCRGRRSVFTDQPTCGQCGKYHPEPHCEGCPWCGKEVV